MLIAIMSNILLKSFGSTLSQDGMVVEMLFRLGHLLDKSVAFNESYAYTCTCACCLPQCLTFW